LRAFARPKPPPPFFLNGTHNLSPSRIVTNIASNINFVSLFKLYLICVRSLFLSFSLSLSLPLFLSLSFSLSHFHSLSLSLTDNGQNGGLIFHASLKGARVSALYYLTLRMAESQRVYLFIFSLVVESFGSHRKICSEI